MNKPHIHIIKMGGTIEFFDPAYDLINKRLMKLDATIESYLNLLRPHFSYSTEEVATKDSRELTGEDRDKLVKSIQSTNHENILVTHGTFTMSDTAKYLEEHINNSKKVILTGSMIPIIGFTTSDAGFNLGFAIASYPHLENGVYIGMNGAIFSTDEVAKNADAFRFE